MLTLALDTALAPASCALVEDGAVLMELTTRNGKNHSARIIPLVEALLSLVDKKPEAVDLFAVSAGPGSFTGLRIGVVTIKGMAYALQKPAIGVNTLDSLAYSVPDFPGLICPMIDARNNQVYTALYRRREQELATVREAVGLPVDQWADTLSSVLSPGESLLLVGDGAPLHKAYLESLFPDRVFSAEPELFMPRAAAVALLAEQSYRKGKAEDFSPFNLEPFYLRPSQAERMKSEGVVRNLSHGDLEQVLIIENKSFGVPWSRGMFEEELANTNAFYKVIEINGSVIAYGGMWKVLYEGHITNIAVHPDFRRKGLGRKVLSNLFIEAGKQGVHFLTLEVRVGNEAAIRLYESLGFEVKGRRKRYYSDNHEDAFIMWAKVEEQK